MVCGFTFYTYTYVIIHNLHYNIYILYICAIIFAEVAIVITGNNLEQSEAEFEFGQ